MSRVYDTKLKVDGSKVVAFSIKSTKTLTREEVEKKVEKIKSGFKGNYALQVCINTDYGPKDGKTFSNKNRVILCDDYEWETTNSFTVYAWKLPSTGGGCDDENNDCLYQCIVDTVSKFRLPKGCKTPEYLKEYLGLQRDDLIDIKHIPKVEQLYNLNINVIGDGVYTSPNKYPTKQTINIILTNEHYELNELLHNTGRLGRGLTKRQFELVLCDEREDSVYCYDGDTEFKISYDYYLQNKRDIRKTGISYINKYEKKDRKTKREIGIVEAYDKLKQETQTLLEITKGKYDLSRSMYLIPDLARKILSNSLCGFDEPDPITELEQHWIFNTDCNSIIFSSKCELENAYSYDKNSCYPSVMSDNHFSFPVKQGEFAELKVLPKIIQYGVYRAIIIRSGDEMKDRYFRFNENNYYTHYHIKTAQALGLEVSLIIDGGANALLYTKNRANGHTYFKQMVSELYALKSKTPLGKQLLSCIWGMLCSKYIINRTTRKRPIDLKTEKIVHIRPIGGDDVMVGYMKSSRYYKYDYARLGIFLTSYNRLQMTELLLPHNNSIHKFHTDGFISSVPLPLDIGVDIGQWKNEQVGKCKINNCNNVEWM